MKVIRPTVITPPMLLVSSLTETEYASWASGTTYAAGARVLSTTTHRIYESVTASNLGHDPTGAGATGYWIDIGPTNQWAMLDQVVGTATVATGSIQVKVTPGAIDTVAVLNTDAELVQVRQTVGDGEFYLQTKTTNVSGSVIQDWYAYFTAEIGTVDTLIFTDIPLLPTSTIEVLLFAGGASAPVEVGTLIVGNRVELGLTETGPQVGITDFSLKNTDAFGVTTVVERPWSKRMTLRSLLPTVAVDGVQRQLASLRAKPALWIGEDGYDSLTVYGFFKDFQIDLALSTVSYVSLTIEGLT